MEEFFNIGCNNFTNGVHGFESLQLECVVQVANI